jgi:hypothetical protein
MPINQQRIRDVLADNTCVVNVYIVNVINEVNAFTLTRIGRFKDPHVFLGLVLLQLLVVVIKISKLFGKNIGVWGQVECRLAIFFLHSDQIEAKSVFFGDFVTVGKLVNLLVLVQTFVLVRFTGTTRPKQVPLVAVCLSKLLVLE